MELPLKELGNFMLELAEQIEQEQQAERAAQRR
jgi:hypothetical protein